MSYKACRISHLLIEESTGNQLVFIREREGERGFPIGIGPLEAMAIQRVLRQEFFPRPLTHDLCVASLTACGVAIAEVRIVKLENDTFFAELVLRTADDREVVLDCRPSDGLALMVRSQDVELLVNEEILAALG